MKRFILKLKLMSWPQSDILKMYMWAIGFYLVLWKWLHIFKLCFQFLLKSLGQLNKIDENLCKQYWRKKKVIEKYMQGHIMWRETINVYACILWIKGNFHIACPLFLIWLNVQHKLPLKLEKKPFKKSNIYIYANNKTHLVRFPWYLL